ncbi:hypothetical protein LOC67_21210 [Stieleria sp. JC731]|uniref:hypothetical protein n=1 Tax=Pirellulaceae TaxID=2691357 RepID=UPI001E625D73|nr:hypothetical protein [Stieleria sp. JC731]MCC9603076.1 hypothetical protein [Stieleria sp. JC731]
MPLRKLWNSICGKGDTNDAVEAPIQTTDKSASVDQSSGVHAVTSAVTAERKAEHKNAEPKGERVRLHTASVSAASASEPAPIAAGAAKAIKTEKPKLDRADAKLCKQIDSMDVRIVLEVGVNDGTRGRTVVENLTRRGHSMPVCYIAVDEFEMGGNTLTLREFHRQLREHPAKVHLVPMPVEQGLDRVLRTYGQVDLILWADQSDPTEAQQRLLTRLSKPETTFMRRQSGIWSTSCIPSTGAVRKAA